MTELYVQNGFNPYYPSEIETWTWNKDEQPPEWMIDYCRVKSVELDGRTILDIKRTSTGGIEFVRAGNNNYSTFILESLDDYICFDHVTKKLFTLKRRALNLLYKKKK
jgi:hypothetical protein